VVSGGPVGAGGPAGPSGALPARTRVDTAVRPYKFDGCEGGTQNSELVIA